MRSSLPFLLAAAMTVGPSALFGAEIHHGNDGNFCVAKGYLAYDDPQRDPTNHVTAHWVRIVRFGTQGISSAEAVSLQNDFGVRWMSCANDRVELGGRVWHYPSLMRCVVETGSEPTVTGSAQCHDDSLENLSKFGEPQSLSIFGPNEPPIRLESDDQTIHTSYFGTSPIGASWTGSSGTNRARLCSLMRRAQP